jgi:hypothetical protein
LNGIGTTGHACAKPRYFSNEKYRRPVEFARPRTWRGRSTIPAPLAAGIDLFMLQFQPFEAEMRRFAAEILPRLRR